MSTVQVSLDTSANPPVTCNPVKTPVNRGNETINWVTAQNQTFSFTSVAFQNNPTCFSAPSFGNGSMSVTDNNTSAADYPYVIVVTLNGVQYSSANSGIGGGAGSPSINNK